jgi:hypothetical protein
MGISIARTEAQGLTDVSLCFFGATNKDLTKSDERMGAGKISIQRQRMFTLGDAVRSALGEYIDIPQQSMGARAVWNRRQGFAQLCFGRREGRHGIGHKEICALAHVPARQSNERVDIVGIGGERAIEKAARLRNIVGGRALIEPSHSLKIEVHRVGGRGQFRTSRLSGDELGVERARQTRDDFILHVEEIGERLIKSLGPEMIPGFGVDQLHVDAHAVSAALNAALEDIASVVSQPEHFDATGVFGWGAALSLAMSPATLGTGYGGSTQASWHHRRARRRAVGARFIDRARLALARPSALRFQRRAHDRRLEREIRRQGAKGERGHRGAKGARGDKGGSDTVTITSWLVDKERFRATPCLSNGQVGATLELRPFFETFHMHISTDP